MSEELTKLLKQLYYRYNGRKNPPINLEAVREYLELEGIDLKTSKIDFFVEKRRYT